MNFFMLFILLLTLGSCSKFHDEDEIHESNLTSKQKTFLKELTVYDQNKEGKYENPKRNPIVIKVNTDMGGEWILVRHFYPGDTFQTTYEKLVAYNLKHYYPGQVVDFFRPLPDDVQNPSVYDVVSFEGGENSKVPPIMINHVYSWVFLPTGLRSDSPHWSRIDIRRSGSDSKWDQYWVRFEENSSSYKDLESLGARLESLANEELSLNLEENYGLSEERAASVAKITSSFQKIQNKRALTAKEMSIYTHKILGVDYISGKKALEKHIQGDSADMEAMMERAADLNGTSPEAVQDLMGEYLLK